MKRMSIGLWRVIPICGMLATFVGCQGPQISEPALGFQPTENAPVSLNEYIVNPPDQLFIEMQALPSPLQEIAPGDVLNVAVANTLPDHPVAGQVLVDSDGTIDLGYYGRVVVAGQTVEQAIVSVDEYLKKDLAEPRTSLSIASVTPISGNYLVRPDGRVDLGFYGNVRVAGMTLPEAEQAIVAHLESEHEVVHPEINVDVTAYNSMTYYIISDGAGFGDAVSRLPITGHETVLDALSNIGGLPQTGSRHNVWIARPIEGDPDGAVILPVDWVAITKHGSMATNYQVLAGDRIFVKADKLTKTDNMIAKVFAPVERVLGATTLFTITINQLSSRGQGFNNNF